MRWIQNKEIYNVTKFFQIILRKKRAWKKQISNVVFYISLLNLNMNATYTSNNFLNYSINYKVKLIKQACNIYLIN